jgi:rare lipoprotein A
LISSSAAKQLNGEVAVMLSMNKRKILIAVFCCGFFVIGYTQKVCSADAVKGKATIYSDKFNGKKTSTGSKFSQGEATAASNKFPLGSKVKVQNQKNGKATTVKITDRMGKNCSAAVDLSKSTANKLGVKGTAPVKANVVSKPDNSKSAK